MLQRRCKRQNMLLRAFIIPGCQEQTTKRDEHITSPAPRPVVREMGETCRQRRRSNSWVERSRLDQAMHLYSAQRQVLREVVPS